MLQRAQSYSYDKQINIFVVAVILHNFIILHQKQNDPDLLDVTEFDKTFLAQNETLSTVSAQTTQGNEQELAIAERTRDMIATNMWNDYQKYISN
jgi:hypothetical protein